jgi:outer membrane protein OmpA-like peptidoglycan-associated protein
MSAVFALHGIFLRTQSHLPRLNQCLLCRIAPFKISLPQVSTMNASSDENNRYAYIVTGVLVGLIVIGVLFFSVRSLMGRDKSHESAGAPLVAGTAVVTPALEPASAAAALALADPEVAAAAVAPTASAADVAEVAEVASIAPKTAAAVVAAEMASAAAHGASESAQAANQADPMQLEKLYFSVGSAQLPSDASEVLGRISDKARNLSGVSVVISGFHDASGSAAKNAELAKQRALAVRHALEANGVSPDRLVMSKPEMTKGKGDAREARRVEVRLR